VRESGTDGPRRQRAGFEGIVRRVYIKRWQRDERWRMEDERNGEHTTRGACWREKRRGAEGRQREEIETSAHSTSPRGVTWSGGDVGATSRRTETMTTRPVA